MSKHKTVKKKLFDKWHKELNDNYCNIAKSTYILYSSIPDTSIHRFYLNMLLDEYTKGGWAIYYEERYIWMRNYEN